MKLTTILPLLATAVFASTEEKTSPADPTPAGALWTATWNATTLSPYTQSCRTTTTHRATLYQLSQLYPDLESYAPQLKVFYNKQLYPGSWSGIDKHGNDRELLMMELASLPPKVRKWIGKESTQRHYSVHDGEDVEGDGVVFFAPGAVYPILPLWVEDAEGAGCEGMSSSVRKVVGGTDSADGGFVGVFEGLESYANEPADGKTIGKVSHKVVGEKEVEFTVEAMVVKTKAKEGGERSEL